MSINKKARHPSFVPCRDLIFVMLVVLCMASYLYGLRVPIMAAVSESHWLIGLLGRGKGSGAALLFLMIAGAGVAVCLYFRRDRHIRALDE